MKSHRLCESDLVRKEYANSPCSPPPLEQSLLINCFPCKRDSVPSRVWCKWWHAACPQGQGPYLLWILLFYFHTANIYFNLTVSNCPLKWGYLISCHLHSKYCIRALSYLCMSYTLTISFAHPPKHLGNTSSYFKSQNKWCCPMGLYTVLLFRPTAVVWIRCPLTPSPAVFEEGGSVLQVPSMRHGGALLKCGV